MVTQLKYTLTQGEDFDRLVIIKDSRTRRIRKVDTSTAYLRSADGTVYPLPTTRSREGGITLCLTPAQTFDLTPGMYEFDIVASPLGETQTVAQGTIEVLALDRITPLEGDPIMTLRLTQFTDFRKTFDWQSAEGTTLQISDARMQVRDALDAVVLDIGYFEMPPSEAAIAALDPDKRGYLSPMSSVSFELHVSDKAVVAPGKYSYDILAQEAGGDWGKVVGGSLIVEASTTDPTS